MKSWRTSSALVLAASVATLISGCGGPKESPAAGNAPATAEVAPAEGRAFYYAEDYHQQYLYKVPNGYCGLGGTGVTCPI